MEAVSVDTKPFDDQKPGTSGLRKSTQTFLTNANYTENFVQSILLCIDDSVRAGCTLVVGGDGRYYMKEAIGIIIQMAAANKVGRLIIGEDGILSTPAVSNLIRKHSATGGIILTASHNPGGPDADFGIKYNTANGGPAPSNVTDRIYAIAKSLRSFAICRELAVDISRRGSHRFDVSGSAFVVDVISAVDDYVAMMKSIFDFPAIVAFIRERNVKLLFDSLHGVVGPYARAIVCDELHAGDEAVVHAVPKEDFGGGHPDPNLTYARDLVDVMKRGEHDLGVAFDGDGDRNMIIGKRGFFVSPCDSLAVIAANCHAIPYFRRNRVSGFARSMPTSGAVDLVARDMGVDLFETPTGWKFFGNLMDAGKICLCGEESFGTGSDHVREKDGMWAALAWLSILADRRCSVQEIIRRHWRAYGRNCFTRYDYEQVDADAAAMIMQNLATAIADKSLEGRTLSAAGKSYKVHLLDDYEYQDPIDNSVATKQGIRIVFADGSRLIFRLSGTGSSGATIRMYIDSYVDKSDPGLEDPASEVLRPLVEIALEVSRIPEMTGRTAPTVIT